MHEAILTGHTIFLRTVEDGDVRSSGWAHWYNDQQVTRFSGNGIYPVNLAQEERIVNDTLSRSDAIMLAVVAKDKNAVIGNICLSRINHLHRNADISVMIGHPEYQGRTAAIEAIGLMVQHGFGRLNLHRIYGGSHIGLKRFVHMMGIYGFSVEGIARQEFMRGGEYFDILKYSVLQPEYIALKSERQGHFIFPSLGQLIEGIGRLNKDSKNPPT